jgi:hypothetical protein
MSLKAPATIPETSPARIEAPMDSIVVHQRVGTPPLHDLLTLLKLSPRKL